MPITALDWFELERILYPQRACIAKECIVYHHERSAPPVKPLRCYLSGVLQSPFPCLLVYCGAAASQHSHVCEKAIIHKQIGQNGRRTREMAARLSE